MVLNEQHAEGVWGPSHRWLTIGLILVIVGAAFEALAVATTLPATTAELGGLALYGWAFSAFMLTNLIGITIAGAEADRMGPTRPFVIGVVFFTVGLIVAGSAPSMPIVILGRAIQGLGAGTVSSVAYVAIGRGYHESARPRMLALLSSAWVIPGLVGPAIAGVIADHVGWRWVFYGLAPMPVLAAAMALPSLRTIGAGEVTPRNWRHIGAAVQLAVGVGLALAAGSLGSPALVGGLIVLGALIALPALHQLMPPGTLRAAHGLPAAIATMAFLNFAFFGADSFVPLMLTSLRSQTATQAGLALTAATVTWTTGAWIQAHLAGGGKRRGVVLAGLALIAIGIIGVALATLPAAPALLALLAWGVAGLGMGLAFSTISLVVLENAPAGQEGQASAAMQLANVLGVAVGAGLGGAIVAATQTTAGPQPSGFIVLDGVMLLGVAAALLTALRMSRGAQPSATSTTWPEATVPEARH